MENIQLRNSYISKIQKQLSKTINSIDLLQKLQNVINQSGGSDLSTQQLTLADAENSLNTARELNAIDRSGTLYVAESDISFEDTRIKELEGSLTELEKLIEKLKKDLADKGTVDGQIVNKINELETEKTNLNAKLIAMAEEKRNNEDTLTQMQTTLRNYNTELAKLRNLIPKSENTDILNFNNIIDNYINTVKNFKLPTNITNQKILNKVNEKFQSINNEKEITDLINNLQKLKIVENDLKSLPQDLLRKGVELKIDQTKAIEELIKNKNSALKPLISEGIYKNIKEFNNMSLLDNVIRLQTISVNAGGELSSSLEVVAKNKYFGFELDDFKQ